MITLSAALILAQIAGADVRAADHDELLEQWRSRHPHPRMCPVPGHNAQITCLGWRDREGGALHLRYSRAAAASGVAGVVRLRLTVAVLEVAVQLVKHARSVEQGQVQIVALDRFGEPPMLVRQSPGLPCLIKQCHWQPAYAE